MSYLAVFNKRTFLMYLKKNQSLLSDDDSVSGCLNLKKEKIWLPGINLMLLIKSLLIRHLKPVFENCRARLFKTNDIVS